MKIAIVGVGYVGLVSGTCFAEMGNDVWCVDKDKEKITELQNTVIPIFEPGLKELVQKNIDRLHFVTDIDEALQEVNVCFIAVGTPPGEDGSADLSAVLAVASSIGRMMVRHMFIVDKSTVPVGTSRKVRKAVQHELDARDSELTFDVISNPEFLKEGTAVHDCLLPDRIIVGTESEKAARLMAKLYKPFLRSTGHLLHMDIASAEMTKYAANCMLATKISFINEIANICELVGADVNKVRMGIGSDPRIGYSFIFPGCGYGGSCFPKDVQALIRTSGGLGYEARILKAVEAVNESQKQVLPRRIVAKYGENLEGLHFTCWGLSFKPDTDDMRCAASLVIVGELTKRGAKVHAYDPQAEKLARTIYFRDNKNIEYFDGKYDALKGCAALILITEWKEFRCPDFERIKECLKEPVIFDGRNQYESDNLREMGFEYYQIGVGDNFVEWR
ncbi:putative UDP-glucose/GDP-mannose 6-dehydrogenase [Selenomonas ruminantium subsp. lactilytica TAM6421]|uniref:UDP-glucose 6-dehydrogenase n=1 Tax=Selenomonas ruminantium subsp. lactilytica (strain NBRC 103574 / TAM6421) TaxID=927704 RepID=I0GTI4_SELRL|nr:UDP-glucose/GDP-mannose dehydrogenase family protein [Selenomonas ruminantium]BAL84071.1 putative UDP-glucose/GDP-mannose 6-dehydrogenase [Selenomonas ruminantium subsp. lactilytica TAM6421]